MGKPLYQCTIHLEVFSMTKTEVAKLQNQYSSIFLRQASSNLCDPHNGFCSISH